MIANGVRVQKVLLYGSHARNDAHQDSDIDIIIVSDDFADKNLFERLQILGQARREVPEPIQAYGFTPSEIGDRLLSAFWEEIVEHEAVLIPAEALV